MRVESGCGKSVSALFFEPFSWKLKTYFCTDDGTARAGEDFAIEGETLGIIGESG